jgi:hypothetical protein
LLVGPERFVSAQSQAQNPPPDLGSLPHGREISCNSFDVLSDLFASFDLALRNLACSVMNVCLESLLLWLFAHVISRGRYKLGRTCVFSGDRQTVSIAQRSRTTGRRRSPACRMKEQRSVAEVREPKHVHRHCRAIVEVIKVTSVIPV